MIELKNFAIGYKHAIIKHINICVNSGQIVYLKGKSGCGKSTLLYTIGLLMDQKEGTYILDGKDITNIDDEQKAEIKRNVFGFVFQEKDIIQHLTVKENIQSYASLTNHVLSDHEIETLLNKVHLHVDLNRTIQHLSGGERQRLSIACALAKGCRILLLDEPTSALDVQNEQHILKLLQTLAHEEKLLILMSSHRDAAIEYADVVYEIENETLICTKNINTEEINTLEKRKPLSEYFISNYHHKYRKANILLNICFIGLFSILFMFYIIFLQYTNIHVQQMNQKVEESSDLQLLITYNNEISYDDFKQEINTLKETEIVYPYEQMEITLNQGESYSVIPIFEENNQDIYYKYYNSEKDGFFCSYALEKQMKETITKDSVIEGYFNESLNSNSLQVLGTLKKEYEQKYILGQDQFFLMPYETYKNYLSGKENAYVVFVQSLDKLIFIEKTLNEKGIEVYDEFQPVKQLYELQQLNLRQTFFIQCGVGLLMLCVIIFVQVMYVKRRKYEGAILLANGLSKKQMNKILVKGTKDFMIGTIIIFELLIAISWMIQFITFLYVEISILLSIIMYFIAIGATYIFSSFIDTIKVLRK